MSGALKPYPAYKASGVEWLGAVPEGWEVVRLRFLADLNPSPTEIDDTDEEREVQFLPMEAVGDDGSLSLEQLRPIVAVKSGYTYFAEGDVTYAKITPCFENGKGAILQGLNGGFGFGSTELTVLRPRQRIDRRFLWQITASRDFRSLGESYMYGAGGQKRVPNDFARNLPIPLPPLPEQQAIADYLDAETQRIDTLIAELREMIRLLKEKRQALISHCVTKGLDPTVPMKDSGVEWLGEVPEGWEVIAIKWLSPVQRGASPRPIDDPKYFDEAGEYGWVRIRDVTASNGRLKSTEERLSSEGSLYSVKLEPGQLFVSIAGSVGKPCITEIKACIHDGFVFFPDLRDGKDWVYTLFESGECYQGLGKLGTQLNLNTDTIGSIRIPMPPKPERVEILRFLDRETAKIDHLISETEDTITLMQERRSALISSVVTGKLQVPGVPQPSGSTLDTRPEKLR